MSNANEAKYVIFSGLSGGVGATTMAMAYCSYRSSMGEKVCLIFENESRYNEVKDLNLDYDVINLNKETDINKDTSYLVLISDTEQSSIIKRIRDLKGSINYLLVEPTRICAERVQSRLISDDEVNYKVVINKVLTNRKTHTDIYNKYFQGFPFLKNRMNYELVLNGTNLFAKDIKLSGISNLQAEFSEIFSD